MRVALIDPSLFTLPYDQALAAGLAHAGHETTVFGRRPGPDDGDRTEVALVEAFYHLAGSRPVAALPNALRLGIKGLDHLWSMLRLSVGLARRRPDVIHFQWLPLPLMDRRLLARFRRIAPLVLTVHDTNPFNGNPSAWLQARGFAECFGHFERLIVHTEQGHARLCAQGVPAERLMIVPHGVMGPPPQPLADDPMTGTITFVLFGKLKPYKGADLLVAAFASLPPELRAQARLRIVGKPYMDLEPLHAVVRAHGLQEQVTIEPRFVPDDEIPAVFGPGTVAVFPYREIDTSAVLYQALGHGRPVIATRLGTFAEMLRDGVHGRLTAIEDIPGLAAAMAGFIADRAFAAACGVQALALSDSSMDWDTVARRTASIYAAAIEDARGNPARRAVSPAPSPAF